MRQIIHIFAKDSRRLWIEIAISVAIAAAFAWMYPVNWKESETVARGMDGYEHFRMLKMLASALTVLVPVKWVLLIARVIHAESLVGDRQFWVTRPYVWWKLMAAKALFLAVYLYLPFIAAQYALLAVAGFQPLRYMPGLLFNLLLATGILVAPLVALAAVTKNFARMVLTLLALVMLVILIAYLVSLTDSASAYTPGGDRITIPVILAACGGAVVVQYAARKVWLARVILGVVPLVVMLTAMSLPNLGTVEAAYPELRGAEPQPVHIAYGSQQVDRESTLADEGKKEVEFTLPIVVSGAGSGYAAKIDDVMVTLESANGDRWSSPWRAVYNHEFLPGVWRSNVNLSMKRETYDRFKAAPVTLRVKFALTEMKAGQAIRVEMREREFAVPEFGVCPPLGDSTSGIPECRSAFHPPQLTHVSAIESSVGCGSDPANRGTSVETGSWVGSLDNDPAEFGITSVWTTSVYLARNDGQTKGHFLCDGAPLTFTQYSVARRTQEELSVANFRLPRIDNRSQLNLVLPDSR